jgi:hypothetical protein
VTSTVYDHTSVLKLVQQKWNLPALTRRDAAAESPLDALDLDAEPAFLKPPDLPEPSLAWKDWATERANASRSRLRRHRQSRPPRRLTRKSG